METNQTLIFVVEDDPYFNKLLTSFLSAKNIGIIKSFFSGEDCIENMNEQPDIIVMDYILPLKNGLEIMQEAKKLSPKTKYIFISGQSNVKACVEAIKLGAVDYIVKDNFAKDYAFDTIYELERIKTGMNGRTNHTGDSSFYL